MRQRRRLRCVARDAADVAAMDALEQRRKGVEIHRFFQAVANCLADERMIRDDTIAGDVLQAGRRVREHRGHQVVSQHPLERRRHLAAVTAPRDRQRDRRVPAPARLKDRRVEERLHEHVAGGRRMQIPEDVREGKRVLRTERQHQCVFGRRSLQLEVELAAEPFPQRQSPRLVDPAPERRVEHELHAARLVEEALEDERVLRRQDAEDAAALREIRDDLFGGGEGNAGLGDKPVHGSPKGLRYEYICFRRSCVTRIAAL